MKFSAWVRMRLGLFAHPQFYRRPLSAIARRLLWKAVWSRRESVLFRTQYGFEVEGSPADIGIGSLFYRGQYEWGELELWQRLLGRPGLTVVDIGANIGLYSLLAAETSRARGYGDGRIFGFEPNPAECAKFRRNVEINGYGTVRVEQVAVSDRVGICRMALPPEGLGVFGHLISEGDARHARDKEVEVATVDLDGWCAGAGVERIDLLKIDVEGHELQVLEGAAGLLGRKAIGVVLMEVGHGEWRRCVEILRESGFAVHAIGTRGDLDPLDPDNLRGWSNVLALAPGARSLLR